MPFLAGLSPSLRLKSLLLIQCRLKGFQLVWMPAGMDRPKPGKLDIQRQSLEPGDGVFMERGTFPYLREKFLVLLAVLIAMGAEILPWPGRVRRGIGNGIEFMIPHDGQRLACFHHGAGYLYDLNLLRPTIYKVTQKQDFTLLMAPYALQLPITQLGEKVSQGFGVPVYIPNNVVHITSSFCR